MLFRQWTLVKEAETFVFRCSAGGEGRLLAEIADQVAAGRIDQDQPGLSMLIRTITASIPAGESAMAVMMSMDQGDPAEQAEKCPAEC